MRTNRTIYGFEAGFVAAVISVVSSTGAIGSENASEQPTKYVPPKRGAPKVRVSSASRGDGDGLPSLYVLAPDHVGLTVQTRPRLFWYQSDPTDLPIAFSLAEADAIEPLFEFTLRGSHLYGQVPLALADFGVSLVRDAEYRWVVTIVPDPTRRSRDVISEGRIMRIVAPEALVEDLNKAAREDRASIYARHGIWYDALAAIYDQIQADPENEQWGHWCAAILKEVELDEPAASLEKAPARGPMQSEASGARPTTPTEARQSGAPPYVPGRRGAPSRLVSSATRVSGAEPEPTSAPRNRQGPPDVGVSGRTARDPQKPIRVVSVLAPEHDGLTTREQPSLFWYLSERVDVPINLRVFGQDADEPLCDITLRRSDCRGIQRLDLGKLGISLMPGKDYWWMVTLVVDPVNRSRDLIAEAVIRRVLSPPQLETELADAEMADRPGILVRHGIWCDAVAALSSLIEADPGNADLRRQRASLLEELGLNEAAASDLTGNKPKAKSSDAPRTSSEKVDHEAEVNP